MPAGTGAIAADSPGRVMSKTRAKTQTPTAAPAAPKPLDWKGVTLLGITLIVAGALALLLPEQATVAASTGLGGLLVVAGGATIIQVVRDKGVTGFNWHMLAGAAELVGGLLIWVSPLKGAAAIALLVVVIIAVQGFSHVAMAIKARPPQGGRIELGLSGLISLVIALVLVLRFPYSSVTEPGAMAGIALIVAGGAHLILGLARHRARPSDKR